MTAAQVRLVLSNVFDIHPVLSWRFQYLNLLRFSARIVNVRYVVSVSLSCTYTSETDHIESPHWHHLQLV